VTIEETNAGDGVTRANDETDTDESKNEKRKSRAKSVTLKDEALTRSNSGQLFNFHVHTFFRLGFFLICIINGSIQI